MEKVKKVEVPIPEGFKAEAKFANGVMTIEIEKIETEPKKKEWQLEVGKEYFYLSSSSNVCTISLRSTQSAIDEENSNSFRHESDAEAMLAYIQLLEMYYQEIGDYVPNWDNKNQFKYVIKADTDDCLMVTWVNAWKVKICFPTREQAEKFLYEYSDLIEQAKRFI
jgi:hypothetical protein